MQHTACQGQQHDKTGDSSASIKNEQRFCLTFCIRFPFCSSDRNSLVIISLGDLKGTYLNLGLLFLAFPSGISFFMTGLKTGFKFTAGSMALAAKSSSSTYSYKAVTRSISISPPAVAIDLFDNKKI
jgi:hypothetical protein